MSGTGLPLWSKQFGRVKHSLDPALIAGLLTAIKGFSDQAIGSELTDLVLENDKLHNFIVSEEILFTVHIDRRVDEHEKLDDILEKAKDFLLELIKGSNINSLISATFKEFQNLVKSFTPGLDEIAIEIASLRSDLIMIHDEKSFDANQLKLLSRVPELVPYLTKHQISIQIKDLKTKKIHFQQLTKISENSANINDMMNFLENQNFFTKDLETIPSQIFFSKTVISAFKIPVGLDNIFIMSKENVSMEQLSNFRKCTFEVKKKILDFF